MKNTADEQQADMNDPAVATEESIAPLELGSVTPEQFAELKDRASKADENWNRLLRVTADFENFKKRAARERTDAIKFANEGVLQKLIPVLDSFDMALAAVQSTHRWASDQSVPTRAR